MCYLKKKKSYCRFADHNLERWRLIQTSSPASASTAKCPWKIVYLSWHRENPLGTAAMPNFWPPPPAHVN
jgi:hypothetical protein